MQKILTIAIPTYNRSVKLSALLKFLYDELKELSSDEIECISVMVSDNCSTDDTKVVVESSELFLSGKVNCEYSCNKSNVGLLGNLKKIYSHCQGQYLWMMGDDDVYEKGIVKAIYDECKKNEFSYIFINHTTFKSGKIIQASVIEDLDPTRTDKHALMDLYLKSGTVMMFMSACVYKVSLVKRFIRWHRVRLTTPCALSFYCASKGRTKIIAKPYILNDWTDVSWTSRHFQVFYIELPRIFISLPFQGYNLKKCLRVAYGLTWPDRKAVIYYYYKHLCKRS